MPSPYQEESIQIADKFIKTVCFVDDQPIFNNIEDPVNEDIDHRLNANVITKAFASSGKSCSFYQYRNIAEEDDIIKLANISDVNVLDWRIILSEDAIPQNIGTDDEEDAEVDVEEKESRGKYALRLIEKILLLKNYDSPKLILILTAETDIDAIYTPVKEKLISLEISFDEDPDELSFQNENFRISIFFKGVAKEKYLSDEVRRKSIELVNLPNIVNTEFAKLTEGLVLGTALQCISMVRSKTFLLLGSYNRNLDPAYLTHRALLPDPNDAEDLLVDIIGSDIKSILKGSNIIDKLRSQILPKYIDQNFNEEKYPFIFPEFAKIPDIDITPEISAPSVKSIIINGIENTYLRKSHPIDQQLYFRKNCHKNLILTFENEKVKADHSNIQFAILTTVKPDYQLSKVHLTLGTVLKDQSKTPSYWLCMQPKCDSVRIDTRTRAFLLLKLNISDPNSFHLIVDPKAPTFLKIKYEIYKSKLTEFKSDENGNVSSFEEDGKVLFRIVENNKNMIWIGELKNDIAQSISNTFSSQLSRVGLNPSEWLRRNS